MAAALAPVASVTVGAALADGAAIAVAASAEASTAPRVVFFIGVSFEVLVDPTPPKTRLGSPYSRNFQNS
jgi:hypothetical protein